MRFENGETVMQGDVTIVLNNAVALAGKVTYISSKSGLTAKADKVAVNFKWLETLWLRCTHARSSSASDKTI